MQHGLLGFGIHRPVGMLMIVLAGVVFGMVSLTKLPVDLLPAIDYPSLTVRTLYPGAAPEDVEERVTEKLEDVLSTVGKLVRIRSSSRAEVSEILMEFEWGSNLPFLVQDVRERIDRVFLSQGVERPLILRYDPSLDPILRIAVAGGNDLVRLRDIAEQEIEREIEGLSGVAAVRVRGGLEDEIQVQVDPQRLANLRVPASLLLQRLREENLNVPGGTLEEGATEYVVRTLNEFRTLDQIRDLPVVTRGEATIRVRDLATVARTHKDRDVILRTDGQEAVEIEVFREDGANIVDVAETVLGKLFGAAGMDAGAKPQAKTAGHQQGSSGGMARLGPKPIASQLPSDIKLTVLSDQSQFVSGAIGEVRQAAMFGGMLAILVCYLFLRRLAVTFIIALSIPVSVIAAFGAMYGAGVTLNVMSLGGLALGIGMLVDNSIVVLESITRCREEGDPPMQAALRGVSEVGSAVTASTLTTIAVFAPIVFVEGIAGQTFGDQSLTVVASLLISLAVALFFIPGLAARSRLGVAGDQERPKLKDWAGQLGGSFRPGKMRGVSKSKLVWGLGILSLLATGFMQSGMIQPLLAPFTVGPDFKGPRPEITEEVQQQVTQLKFIMMVVALPAIWTFGHLLLWFLGWIASMAAGVALVAIRLIGSLAFLVFWTLTWPLAMGINAFMAVLDRVYQRFLKAALHAPLMVGLLVAVIAWSTYSTGKDLGRELLPEVLQSEMTAELFFPAGSPLPETDRIASQLEQKVRAFEGVSETAVASGSDRESVSTEEEGPHTSRILIRTLRGPGARERELEVEAQLRKLLDGEPALARYNVRRPTLLALNAPLEIEIIGDDLISIGQYAREVENALTGVEGIVDLRSSIRRGNPEVRVELDRVQLARHNLTVAQVAERLRLAVEGQVSSTFPGKDERIDIRVRADLSHMQHVEQLALLPVNPDAEKPLTLGAVAKLPIADGPSEIRHIGGRRAAVLSASLSGFDLGATAAAVEARLAALPPQKDRVLSLGGQTQEMDSALDSLTFALMLAIFLVYAVMAAQFESLVQPLLIMFSVPLAASGAIWALGATGTPISVVALLGALVLAGIVVNNAIVLVDRINQNRKNGQKLEVAILEAGRARLRPILMTTVTTVLGMLPLTGWLGNLPFTDMFAASEGTELRAPMALVVIAGLTASTLLTLVVIPVGYRVLALATQRND
ncbi:MAG: efflux RND transporter permease subunit [Planctomycetes bacterium]|nr:efflux RND transporter permease subunit [Planctomycetota bacterium]